MVRVLSFSCACLMLAGSAAAVPSTDRVELEQQQALQEALDSATAQLMAPGPKLDNWNKGGVDIYRLLRTAPGGVSQNYLLSTDRDGERDITVIDTEKTANYVPKSWNPVLREGTTQAHGPSINLTLAPIDGPFFLAGWDKRRQVGDAFCSDGGMGAELYEAAGHHTEPELPRVLIPTMFVGMVKQLKDKVVCWRFDPDGAEYKVTYFLEDGSTLPAMNAYEERVRIVAAGPVDKLIEKVEAQD